MKTVIIQTTWGLLLYLMVLGLGFIFQDLIGWFYIYLIVAGYLIFIFTTSTYNWIITIFQFLIAGFLSFVIIGSLYNGVYEQYIEQNFNQFESEIATTIALIELILIKLFSDFLLSKIRIKKRKSMIEKILLLT